MIRLFLCLLLILCAWLAGRCYTSFYSRRCDYLSGLLEGFRSMDLRMQYQMDPLPLLFAAAAKGRKEEGDRDEPLFLLFDQMSRGLEEAEMEPGELWKRLVKENLGHTSLEREELRVIGQLGEDLGRTDLEGQRQALSHMRRRLEALLEKAQEDKKRSTKLYRALFTAGGVMGAILLI